MKSFIITLRVMKGLILIATSTFLFSFSEFGGESYAIYLNDKMVAQEYLTRKFTLPNISLDQAASTDQLVVYYNHCGRIGKSRTLRIKDQQQKVLKEWSYTDATVEHTPMTIAVRDIAALSHDGDNKLNLVYTSSEAPDGKLLAYIVLNKVVAGR